MSEETDEMDYYGSDLDEYNGSLSTDRAFRDYHSKPEKVKRRWGIIIIVSVITALISVISRIYADLIRQNPYAMNFVISLYGVPAGFVIAYKNHHHEFYKDILDAEVGAIIYALFYFLFGVIVKFTIGDYLSNDYGTVPGILFEAFLILLFSLFGSFIVGSLIATGLKNYLRGTKKK
jgi:membrane protease YdiL (CAAX protease family)